MIKHGMDVLRHTILFLNLGQIPFMAMDAPLDALTKCIHWNWPETHGEDQYVVMLGGFHIEQTMWETLGDYLEGSGWTTVLTQASVASSGIAHSFLNCCHITKTWKHIRSVLLPLQSFNKMPSPKQTYFK